MIMIKSNILEERIMKGFTRMNPFNASNKC